MGPLSSYSPKSSVMSVAVYTHLRSTVYLYSFSATFASSWYLMIFSNVNPSL